MRSFSFAAAGLAAALLCSTTPLQAQTADSAEAKALIAAITANGCAVTDANNAEVLKAAGLSDDQAKAVVSALIAAGQAEVVGEDLRLKTEGCN